MLNVTFLMTHTGSDWEYFVNSLNSNPRIEAFNTENIYNHPSILDLFKEAKHKLGKNPARIYLDVITQNHAFNKTLEKCVKFIYFINSPMALGHICQNNCTEKDAYLYYVYRLRRLYEIARRAGGVYITRDDFVNNNDLNIIEQYLNLKEPLKNVEIPNYEFSFDEKLIKKAWERYEWYNYAFKNLSIEQSFAII